MSAASTLRRQRSRLAAATALAVLAALAGAGAAHAGRTPTLLAATPYMGWDSSYALAPGFTEATVLEQASQLKQSGLEARGYRLIWLDAGWWQGQRDATGRIVVSATQWPHGIAWLAATLHANGFELGVYTDAGATGCAGPQGSYGHYQQDIDTFAAWGVDAVKVDWCGGSAQGLDPATQFAQIHQAILDNSSHRSMLLEICNFLQPGQLSPGLPSFQQSAFFSYSFGPADATSWRTDTDIGSRGSVHFAGVLRNLDADATEPQAAGPGHWNDPGYLGPDQGMTAAQFRTQFSMWAMLAAPLMISANMLTLDRTALAAVSNRAVIAIDQDPAGIQAHLVPGSNVGNAEAWVRPLSDGSYAVALLNRGSTPQLVATTAQAAGLPAAPSYRLRNVWSNAITATNGTISATVPAYSTVLLRVRAP